MEDNIAEKLPARIEESGKKESILYKGIKRAFDITASSSALLLLSPVMLGIAAAIKIEDRGPVIYKSKRVGTNMEEFDLYKFRSMYVDADKHLDELRDRNDMGDGPRFKMKNDPRVTKVGRFIRKYSLDELPQLWNVLKGDITVVGPRPHSPYEVEKYSDYDCQRFKVKAGLLCYSEVMGRSDLPFDESIELDLKYTRDRSLITDAKILVMAVKAILKHEGAE